MNHLGSPGAVGALVLAASMISGTYRQRLCEYLLLGCGAVASQSWSAWFFGSFDAANFITVDKPPLSTMVMGLSVRIFGLSSWSILLPEALAGVATGTESSS